MDCEFCGQEMNEAASCSKNTVAYPHPNEAGGMWLHAIPYGSERRFDDTFEGVGNHRCHDCGVEVGGYHHPGCDVEESPMTNSQLLSEVLALSSEEAPVHARAATDPHRDLDLSDVLDE